MEIWCRIFINFDTHRYNLVSVEIELVPGFVLHPSPLVDSFATFFQLYSNVTIQIKYISSLPFLLFLMGWKVNPHRFEPQYDVWMHLSLGTWSQFSPTVCGSQSCRVNSSSARRCGADTAARCAGRTPFQLISCWNDFLELWHGKVMFECLRHCQLMYNPIQSFTQRRL